MYSATLFRRLLSIALTLILVEAHATPVTASVEAYFSPGGNPAGAIVREIDAARAQILVQAFSFTHKDIARALAQAKARGVDVEVILDKSNLTGKYGVKNYLGDADIPVLIDTQHAIAHNKVMVIDRQAVITGSFNFTKAAQEKNAENLVIMRSVPLAEEYEANWRLHAKHSERFRRQ